MKATMKRPLSSFFVLFALAGSVLAGMPLHAGMMDSKMMKCCKKAKGQEQSPSANAARLCCAVNCSDPAPTSSISSFNFSPAIVNVSESIARRIADLLGRRRQSLSAFVSIDGPPVRQSSRPKYIQHHPFLI
ncbi:MAG TPA: hypothetical protein PLK77_08355 [Pyrinomonadaceae bacterium]|nr:hypothetical protein [Pyrinomonadaceae bacterium]